jgi:hypothetical protein
VAALPLAETCPVHIEANPIPGPKAKSIFLTCADAKLNACLQNLARTRPAAPRGASHTPHISMC